MEQRFLIKGMVCDRCISTITNGMKELGLHIRSLSLGQIVFDTQLSPSDQLKLVDFLTQHGFQTMSNRHERIIQQIKQLITEHLTTSEKPHKKLSKKLTESLHLNYDSISELFSNSEGITLEKYYIRKRIEIVIELLLYSDKTLTEISHSLGYSSINHLSRQFKEVVGTPPSYYRQLRKKKDDLSDQSRKMP